MKRLILAVFAAMALCVAYFGWTYLRDNKLGNFEGKADIYVYPGTDPEAVISQIEEQTVITRPRALRKVFRKKRVSEFITPGHYAINAETPSVSLARMLNNGWETPVTLTLSGTLRKRSDLVNKISAQMMVSAEELDAALQDTALLAKYGYTPRDLFSLFIPDSYSIFWSASVDDILACQKKANDAFWTEENVKKAAAQGLTPAEASILASIVKGESNYEPEHPKIAGVYLNRLHRGMLLQADPTVAYCFDYSLDRILFKHLEVDSPYNTYKHRGLPPGPICVPTKSCLNAVLNPDTAEGNIFFCANSDFSGTHVFASTLAEHNRNARAFQTELTRRRRAKTSSSR
ncbi:MAG: endolytic transglycosylase MltG [Bacteroidales bacterium]|nr:endolytic transglycosylase MltG [Bacteroidales bacterium]